MCCVVVLGQAVGLVVSDDGFFELLEPSAEKFARSVLRGGGGREASSLPDC